MDFILGAKGKENHPGRWQVQTFGVSEKDKEKLEGKRREHIFRLYSYVLSIDRRSNNILSYKQRAEQKQRWDEPKVYNAGSHNKEVILQFTHHKFSTSIVVLRITSFTSRTSIFAHRVASSTWTRIQHHKHIQSDQEQLLFCLKQDQEQFLISTLFLMLSATWSMPRCPFAVDRCVGFNRWKLQQKLFRVPLLLPTCCDWTATVPMEKPQICRLLHSTSIDKYSFADEWDYGRILLGESCGRSVHAIATVIFQV